MSSGRPYEEYVRTNWADIVNSDAFKNGATQRSYLEWELWAEPSRYLLIPSFSMKSLAEIALPILAKNNYTDGLGTITRAVSRGQYERLMKNVNELTPETIKYSAGFIDAIYQMMSGRDPGGVDPGFWKLQSATRSTQSFQ